MTPPLFLRNDAGEREAVEVDHDFVTRGNMRSTRTTALLVFAAGVRIEVGSRCINKRRVPVLKISAADASPSEDAESAPPGATFRECLARVKPRPGERCRCCGANPCADWCNAEEYA